MIEIRQNRDRRRLTGAAAALAAASLLAALIPAAAASAATVTGAGGGAHVATAGWNVQNTPTPPGATDSSLNGVSCASANPCIAVGSVQTDTGSTGFAERWNGSAWSLQTLPNVPRSGLNAVSCVSKTFCVAVGSVVDPTDPDKILALAEVWNGTTWTEQTAVSPPTGQRTSLTGVSCTSATRCMAVGSSYLDKNHTHPLAEQWNGSTWKRLAATAPGGAAKSQFSAVSCAVGTSCIAVGATSAPTSAMMAEVWNGTAWTVQSPSDPSGGSRTDLQAVSCPATNECIATGGYYLGDSEVNLAESWDGTSWTQQSTPNPAGVVATALSGVSCPSAGLCVAVGGATSETATTDLAEVWDGSAWTIEDPGQPAGAGVSLLDGVSCPKTTDCTAVGAWSTSEAVGLTPYASQYS